MPSTRVRVPGGGNTYFQIGKTGDGYRVDFLANYQDNMGQVVGQTTEIHPIGYRYPVEIATGYAQHAGRLTLTVYALWGEDGWVSAFKYQAGTTNQIDSGSYVWGDAGDPIDLVHVLEAQRKLASPLVVKKFELGADGTTARIKTYNNAIITNIQQNESVRIDTMTVESQIEFMYTDFTISNGQGVRLISSGASGAANTGLGINS